MLSPINILIRKLQSLFFKGRMFFHGKLGLPAQTRKEIKLLKAILDHIESGSKIRIFEWGSGFSTIYYANYLRKNQVDFEWHSIDNNKAWHEKVKALVQERNLKPYVSLYLKEFEPFWKKTDWEAIPQPNQTFSPQSENEIDYINFPKQLNPPFNLVLIDARFRRRCLQITKEVLHPDGIAILHDAQKKHYHAGVDGFKYKRFIDTGSWYPFQDLPNQIWVGSMGNKEIFEKLF